MFVLSLQANETVMIGDDIQVSVLAAIGEKVRLVVQCPRGIPVLPNEVYAEMQREQAESSR
jgi:carbon storage regulator